MARQGVRVLRPTRPAGPVFCLAELDQASPTQDDGLDFTLRHALQDKRKVLACGFRHDRLRRLPQSARRTKTVVVVTVLGLVVVAGGRPRILRVVVERPAAQHAAFRPSPSES